MQNMLGSTTSAVAALLGERLTSRTKPGGRIDGFHLALVIECGGMRGASAGGTVQALYDGGLLPCFDSIYGSSAGACAGAYFLAEQPEIGRAIFHEDICRREVVSPYRVWARPCMVDTDFIVDEIIARKRKIDFPKIAMSPCSLNIVSSCLDTSAPHVHRDFPIMETLLESLRATLRVPGPREQGVLIDGQRHLDGGLLEPIPISVAISSGATHILVVGTQRSKDYSLISPTLRIEASLLKMIYGELFASAYFEAGRRPRLPAQKSSSAIEVLCRPDASPKCSWFCIDKDLLLRVERDARLAGEAFVRRCYA